MADQIQNTKLFGAASLAATENTPDTNFIRDKYWDFASVDDIKLNWNKLYPYQLMVIRRVGQGYAPDPDAIFTLPIPPQELTISTPFAIQTTVTMGGVLEEHNGAPLRMISMRGTTGVTPLRGTTDQSNLFDVLGNQVFGGIFAGTLTGINQAITAVQQAPNLLGGDVAASPVNVHDDSDFQGDLGKSTGYYQFMLLQRFLESYVNMKKNPGHEDKRLAFAIWKEKAVYLVTPVQFDVIRNAASPLEYTYVLQLKAWKRILLDANSKSKVTFNQNIGVRDPNKYHAILNTIDTARALLTAAQNTIKGVRADIKDVLFTPLREISLFSKDLLGVKTAVADFPANITADLEQPLLEYFGDLASFPPISNTPIMRKLEGWLKALSVETGKGNTRAGLTATSAQNINSSNFSGSDRGGASPASKALNNPDDYYELFSQIQVGDLNLRPQNVLKIENERQRVQQLRREDFEQYRNQILQVLADFSDFVGAGDATYTRIYNVPQRTTTRIPTDDDWDIINNLSMAASAVDSLAVSGNINQDIINSLDFVAGLASRSGIAFQVPKSKYAVPFPYGYTLEELSNLYLGTPDRWHEIVALNGLRAPYVDEEGFQLSLLVNGNGNQIIVNDSSNLYVGQSVNIISNTVRGDKRRIQKIEVLSPGQVLVTVDGNQDLAKFTTADQSLIQAFLPDTVNSQMQIYIPSFDTASDDDWRLKSIPGVDYFDPLVRSGGVDLLLTQSNDLVFTPDGNNRLAVGLTNIIQKVRLAFNTPLGSLNRHPSYGFAVQPGVSIADMTAKDILASTKNLFKGDPTFAGVQQVAVQINGNTAQLSIGIALAETSQVIPVTLQIKK